MNTEKKELKNLIREYLLEEDLFFDNIYGSKIAFGYIFIFPPGNLPNGEKVGKKMAVIKPKNKNYIIIEIGIQLPESLANALNILEENKSNQFYLDLKKAFLLKDVYYRIDKKNHRYALSEQIFYDNIKLISKDKFFNRIKKIFNTFLYSTIIIQEYCAGKVDIVDLRESKELYTESDFSLYL
ncbi:MAG: DUF2299 family protein [Promethearchaeota archaeon]